MPFIVDAMAMKSQTSRDLWTVVRSIRQPSPISASDWKNGAALFATAPLPCYSSKSFKTKATRALALCV